MSDAPQDAVPELPPEHDTPQKRELYGKWLAAAAAMFLVVLGLIGLDDDEEPPPPTTTTTTTVGTTTTTAPVTGRPGTGNTGPTSNEGDLERITAAQLMTRFQTQAVVEGVYVTGQVEVQVANRTLRNFVIDGQGTKSYGIRNCGTVPSPCSSPVANFTAEDGRIVNVTSSGFWGGNATLRRLEVHESKGDAFKPLNNVTIEGSWGYDLGHDPDAHADFIQFQSTASNVTIRGNYCDMDVRDLKAGYNSQACIQTNSGVALTNVVAEDNWFAGGNYTVTCNNQTGANIRDNVFYRDSFRYGHRSKCPTWSGNTWQDGGAA